MKKLVLIISSLLVLSANITNLQAKEWYEEKGTLHQSTMKEWCKASDKNKLATAGDLVAVGYNNKIYQDELMQALNTHDIDGLKLMAEELVKGLDSSSCNGKKASKETATTKVSDMSAMLITMMGWIKK
ncbi:hypothetical protein [Gallibacterium sp. AGMB14963]|uniref:hypothetical protein n=1 Tax=Gallibacterium faecale TaxID=3019086 RepID=UPI0022F1CCF9|nr:hypothetical protein [Gallibacterium sp. AGMB14963]MDA3978527.1 hypothetical protein [Gallibacterium sp. AGMB14963]